MGKHVQGASARARFFRSERIAASKMKRQRKTSEWSLREWTDEMRSSLVPKARHRAFLPPVDLGIFGCMENSPLSLAFRWHIPARGSYASIRAKDRSSPPLRSKQPLLVIPRNTGRYQMFAPLDHTDRLFYYGVGADVEVAVGSPCAPSCQQEGDTDGYKPAGRGSRNVNGGIW